MECVSSHALVTYIRCRLSYLYDIDWLEIGPENLGQPVRRRRLWMSGFLRAALPRTRAMSDMLGVFCKSVVADAHVYFSIQGEQAQAMISELGRARLSVPQCDGAPLKYEDTLCQDDKVRLETCTELWEAQLEAGEITRQDAVICDIAHDPRCCDKRAVGPLGTLTRNHHRWSFLHQRALFGVESLAAQGIPTAPVLSSLATKAAPNTNVWAH